MHPILKFIIVGLALFLVSLFFNAFTANTFDFNRWNVQAVFMSVLYSSCILLIYFIKLINEADIREHSYSDEEESF